jgi:hypothetical protein
VAARRLGIQTIFLVIGVGLLGGAAYAYERMVRQPRTWPQTDAVIVSSRVINPRGPAHYAPELIFRLRDGSATRDVRVTPSWSSSSYSVVEGHIARFPADTRVQVAVNPANPADVRYDLTWSVTNLLVPGVLGLLGAVFAFIGLVAGRDTPTVTPSGSLPRWFVPTFVVIGLVIGAIGVMMVRASLMTLRTWPRVDGLVLESRAVDAPGVSRGSGPSRAGYDTSVKFQYVVNGVTHESVTAYGGKRTRARAEQRAREYAPGTVHPIWHRPDDPRVIRFDLGSRMAVFFLPGAMVMMGLVFMGFAVLFGWLSRR